MSATNDRVGGVTASTVNNTLSLLLLINVYKIFREKNHQQKLIKNIFFFCLFQVSYHCGNIFVDERKLLGKVEKSR